MSNSERPVISLRGPLRRKAEGGWEWTGIWVFGLMQDEETNESLESESPRIGKKKGRKKATNSGARPFRYNVSVMNSNESLKYVPMYAKSTRNYNLRPHLINYFISSMIYLDSLLEVSFAKNCFRCFCTLVPSCGHTRNRQCFRRK